MDEMYTKSKSIETALLQKWKELISKKSMRDIPYQNY